MCLSILLCNQATLTMEFMYKFKSRFKYINIPDFLQCSNTRHALVAFSVRCPFLELLVYNPAMWMLYVLYVLRDMRNFVAW